MASLYGLKFWYTRRLACFIHVSIRRRISPDVWTTVGIASGIGAMFAIAAGWWPLALALVIARLGGANLDGAVARARGVARPFGFVLNEVGDRISDFAIMCGVLWLAIRTEQSNTSVYLAWAAIAAATIPTFTSLSSAGAGGTRFNGGPWGKTERCAASVIAAAFPQWIGIISTITIGGSILTGTIRLVHSYKELKDHTDLATANVHAPATAEPITRIGKDKA
ncbi:CDP-alcohol phosphatidyltransferase family protein [Actinomyces vulturis]|uniref:CDP-alcohol phosphatidyltransferase family protein n=1 Tax=Actinomyces vulturis TaxID=1857645 RepID=UPI00082D2A62|nr:CDP-alcohol phosphatidyltransferase family protein [Actinomyces vulturis]